MAQPTDEKEREEEGFIGRWSRLKQQDEAAATVVPAAAPEGADEGRAADAEPALSEAEIVARLPDIETLDQDSDFTVFLQDKVPEALRRQALKRLWRSNPVLANLDGLNDYDEDFTDAATVIAGMQSAYKAGRGYLKEEPPEDELAEDELPKDELPKDELPQDEPAEDEPPEEAAEETLAAAGGSEAATEADEPGAETLSQAAPSPGRAQPGPAQPAPRATKARGTAAARRWGTLPTGKS